MPHPGYGNHGLPPSRKRKDSFFREIPLFIKLVWLVGVVISAGVTAFVLYLLYTLVMHVTS